MAVSTKSSWTYGDPPHTNWKSLATHLKNQPTPKVKRKGPSLMDRIDSLESLLKEKK